MVVAGTPASASAFKEASWGRALVQGTFPTEDFLLFLFLPSIPSLSLIPAVGTVSQRGRGRRGERRTVSLAS